MLKRTYIFSVFVFLLIYNVSEAQDTMRLREFQGAVKSTYRLQNSSESSLNIRGIQVDSFNGGGNYNLTDLMATVPGVSLLSTGPGISKPVIRGLYGNRVLVILNGLKFDNQQWQEEHGLGLSDAGLSRVEIIKGPMGILYGSEAIGGVINLIDEDKAEKGKTETDFRLKTFSNTLGMNFNAGIKSNTGKRWYGLRVSVDNHADYFDGNNKRVLNSRMNAYMLKGHYGFKRKNWISENHLISSFSQFGFIFNDIYTFVSADARYNRSLNINPNHMVILNVLNSENKIYLKKKQQLVINAGLQSNRRMENEGGGAISLDMHLFTAQYQLKWLKKISETKNLMVSASSCYENNTNYGSRKIVPDAVMVEHILSGLYEVKRGKHWSFENGIGGGMKRVHTFLTNSVNTPEKDIKPFNKLSPYYNFLSGLCYRIDTGSTIKMNAASGVRIANLAELSSDGLHEGVFTYEIGNPNLKNEQNFSLNIEGNIVKTYWSFGISPFFNYFNNYIFLAPTTEKWNGFPVFRYEQTTAIQRGLEAQLLLRPGRNWLIDCSVSGMKSTTKDGLYTPYTPANKLHLQVLKTINLLDYHLQIGAGADFYRAQKQLYINELGTPAYHLFNFTAHGRLSYLAGLDWQFTVNNLTNEAYYDHLSRFKYFGILNMGRNYVLSLKWRMSRNRK